MLSALKIVFLGWSYGLGAWFEGGVPRLQSKNLVPVSLQAKPQNLNLTGSTPEPQNLRGTAYLPDPREQQRQESDRSTGAWVHVPK